MDSTTFSIQQLFHQGSYSGCVDLASSTSTSSPNDPETRTRLFYSARSSIALHQFNLATKTLTSILSSNPQDNAAKALLNLAGFVEAHDKKDASKSDKCLSELNDLLDYAVAGESDGEIIKIALATAMQLDGDTIGALETLEMGTASSKELEGIALGVHILLSINRPDLAQKEYEAARKWADDSLLIQVIEAWIGLSSGGRPAQQAFYVYDELSQNPAHAGTQNVVSTINGKAASLAALGKFDEAKKVLEEGRTLELTDPEIIANLAALAPYTSKSNESNPSQVYVGELRKISPNHPYLLELAESAEAFDMAVAGLAADAANAQLV